MCLPDRVSRLGGCRSAATALQSGPAATYRGICNVFLDLREAETGRTFDCDLGIIGSGAAGLTIAHELADGGLDIVVLEAGGFELEPEVQELYEGDNIGLPYFDLDVCRLRYYGGTTNHWAGYCLPFRSYEYRSRPWIPYSGWPFDREEMAPWIERTTAFLGFEKDDWDIDKLAERLGYSPWPLDPRRFENTTHVIRPVRFAPRLRERMAEAQRVRVLLHAEVLEIEVNEAANRVTRVRIATLEGKRFTLRPRMLVLAAGGIENPRLLLLSNRVQREGLGNGHGLVGRFFAEHPVFRAAAIHPVGPDVDAWFYAKQKDDRGSLVAPFVILAPESWEEQEIGPVTFALQPVPIEEFRSEGMNALRRLRRNITGGFDFDAIGKDLLAVLGDLGSVTSFAAQSVWYGQRPNGRIDCRVAMVPVPNPDSRVLLGRERDPLGRPKVVLDWRLTSFDKRSVRRAVELLGAEVARLGIGRLRSFVDDDDTSWPEDLEGANHHVGTTRMSDDPAQGVVNRHGRVHGIDNLYLAGSSIFPFPGIGTPTFMIVALAMRLAAHLRERLGP